jgi:hypothetical protein
MFHTTRLSLGPRYTASISERSAAVAEIVQ